MTLLIDMIGGPGEIDGMKTKAFELVLNRWPYGLELQPSAAGLLLRPRRKARADWGNIFRRAPAHSDDLKAVRGFNNDFDAKEWQW